METFLTVTAGEKEFLQPEKVVPGVLTPTNAISFVNVPFVCGQTFIALPACAAADSGPTCHAFLDGQTRKIVGKPAI